LRRLFRFRSIAAKLSVFTASLVVWVIGVVLAYDLRNNQFRLWKAFLLLAILGLVTSAIARFAIRMFVRPLVELQQGLSAVGSGQLTEIPVCHSYDEIQFIGENFNQMIRALAESQAQVNQYQVHLEDKIRRRTEELEEAMKRALAASQAKSEFLANMSHELRTPMSGVIGMLDLVLESPIAPDQREQIKTAYSCALSLLALLNDILDLSKIEAGRMVLEEIPYNVRNVVEECIKSQLPRAREKGINLSWDVRDDVPRQLLGDPLRFRQILANLISNAVKFTARGSVDVKVNIEPHPESRTEKPLMLGLTVSDTGTGIPREKLKAVFEKFTQADGSISRQFGGTGLGLAITRRLVEMHGGSILVESEVGHGSRFIVQIPTDSAATEIGETSAPLFPPHELTPTTGTTLRRILLVEDNPINQKVVNALLRKRGYGVDIAGHGQRALEMLELRAYSLILMDVQMPVLDGLETTRRIRADRRFCHLPIVAMTAHAMNGDRERCLQAGMNDYLAKPVDHRHLLAIVDQFMSCEAEAPRQQPQGHIVDTELVSRLMDSDPMLLNQMVQLFLQLAPERLERLKNSAAQGDFELLRSDARKMRAAAQSIAASGLASSASELERAAESPNPVSIADSLRRLEYELNRLQSLSGSNAVSRDRTQTLPSAEHVLARSGNIADRQP